MNSRVRQGSGQRGFSLLEVLVAFAILALAVGTILSLFATGLRNTAAASDYARAITLAESQLAYYQGIDPQQLDSSDSNGVAEGFTWHSQVTPYSDVATTGEPARLYRIEVAVSWKGDGKNRTVQLSTLRLGKAPS